MLSLFVAHSVALACGGFFCNNSLPVDQSAERILFAQDPDTGWVETHVQIFYEGPSEEFAWVVPVPSVPEVFLSSDTMFDELALGYAPRFSLDYVEVDWCTHDYDYGGYGGGGSGYYSGYSYSQADTGGGTVTVVDTSTVGAYETVTLQAETSEGLLDWLVGNGFDLPATLDPVLAPYVASESYFVAMRLAKDADDGAVQPIGLRYQSVGVSVPIQLTSIAATPDMRLEIYMLGEYRAVPESYLHVQINEAAVDWFGGGANYDDVVTRAADEAGGHAFATDYTGPSDLPNDWMYDDGQYDTDRIAAQSDPYDAIRETQRQFAASALLLATLEAFVPPPDGWDAQDFYNAVSYYEPPLPPDYTWDGPGLAAALQERIVEPHVRIGDLFDTYPHLTRLTSSLDAAEMTVDPTFVLNREMDQDLATQHTATVRMLCGDGGDWDEAPREFVLPDGRQIGLPSIDELQALGLTEFEYMEPLQKQAALVIEQTSGTEPPVVLADYTDQETTNAETFTSTSTGDPASGPPEVKVEGDGCGCRSGTGSAVLSWVALLPVLLRRRR